jgi:hypothetical protein
VCQWDNIFEIVQEIEKEEAVHEYINNVETDLIPFEIEKPSTKLPKPFRSIIEQAAETFNDLH